MTPELDAAYAFCQQMAQAHYENFPVASRLLPKRMRPHIAAIYAFARTADDFADEPGLTDVVRLRLLDDWGARLDSALGAEAGARDRESGDGSSDARPRDGSAIFLALAHTVRQCKLPSGLLHDLLSAFRQDVVQKRYETWHSVLDYCRRSANPVGRLVLRVAGYDDATLDASSDALCTALQLTNFWQDLEKDWQIGRIYVPAADRARAGAREEDMAAGRITAEWRQVMGEMTQRTRALFAAGRPVCDGVGGRLGWELRLTWLAASRILDRIEGAGYDVFSRRPTLRARDAPAVAWGMVGWKARGNRVIG